MQRTVFTSILTTAALLVSSLAAAFVLTGSDAVWTDGAGVMLACGHLLLVAVAIVGSLVGAARWAVGLGVGLAGVLAVPAVVHPMNAAWVVMVATAGLALAGLAGTGLRAVVRQRPPADAPPPKATALVLGTLASPIVVAGLQPDGVTAVDWLLTAAAVALAAWYTRAHPMALWATRLVLPVLAATAAFVVPLPQAVAGVVFFALLTWLAWTKDARVAVIPLAAPGRSVPIPAELAPEDILDAAGLDARGRRKDAQ